MLLFSYFFAMGVLNEGQMGTELLEKHELHGKLHAALRAWKNLNGASGE